MPELESSSTTSKVDLTIPDRPETENTPPPFTEEHINYSMALYSGQALVAEQVGILSQDTIPIPAMTRFNRVMQRWSVLEGRESSYLVQDLASNDKQYDSLTQEEKNLLTQREQMMAEVWDVLQIMLRNPNYFEIVDYDKGHVIASNEKHLQNVAKGKIEESKLLHAEHFITVARLLIDNPKIKDSLKALWSQHFSCYQRSRFAQIKDMLQHSTAPITAEDLLPLQNILLSPHFPSRTTPAESLSQEVLADYQYNPILMDQLMKNLHHVKDPEFAGIFYKVEELENNLNKWFNQLKKKYPQANITFPTPKRPVDDLALIFRQKANGEF